MFQLQGKGNHQMTPPIDRHMRTDKIYTVASDSDHFPKFSWWAAHASGGNHLELVAEETEHRPVWGLMRGVNVKIPWTSSGRGTVINASVAMRGSVVGLQARPAELGVISFRLTPGVTIQEVTEQVNKAYHGHFKLTGGLQVFYTRKYGEQVFWESYGILPFRKIQSVSLAGGMEVDLLQDAKRFLKEQGIYDRAGRPYKRVYCLFGPPGTGKTSTVMAVASELGKDLAIFNVDSLRDDTFIDLLSNLPTGSVIMFEDVDSMFKQRESKTGGMTFSTLLNALDGILHPRGALIFLTTNHLDRLDAALHRPGRVDRLIEVGNSSAQQRASMWSSVFPGVTPPAILQKDHPNISPAWLSALLFQHRTDPPELVSSALSLGIRSLSSRSPNPTH